jgi:hypothetical protein
MPHPFASERLAEAHRADLLRSAAAWRRGHPADIERTRSGIWAVLAGWHGAVRLPSPLVLAHRRRREPLCACPCPPQR